MKMAYLQPSLLTPLPGQKRLRCIFSVSLVIALTGLSEVRTPVWAQEAISQEEPTLSSVDEIITPMSRSFEEKKMKKLVLLGVLCLFVLAGCGGWMVTDPTTKNVY